MIPEETSSKSQTALKCRSVYMAVYMEISLRQLSKQQQALLHMCKYLLINSNLINAKKCYQ